MANRRNKSLVQKHAFLSKPQEALLNQVLRTRGQAFSEWLNAMIVRCAAERLPESQGDVKKIVPHEVATVAQEALELQGQMYLALAARQTDQVERRRYRQFASPYLNAAAWCGTVIEERRHRQHVLDSGQRSPRHRVNEGASPETASNSSTTDAPNG